MGVLVCVNGHQFPADSIFEHCPVCGFLLVLNASAPVGYPVSAPTVNGTNVTSDIDRS